MDRNGRLQGNTTIYFSIFICYDKSDMTFSPNIIIYSSKDEKKGGDAGVRDIMLEGASAEDLSGVYNQIAEQFNIDMAYRIYQCFRGQQLTFPQRFYSPEYVKHRILEEYNGSNIKELAKKYELSERRVRQIIHERNKEKESIGS